MISEKCSAGRLIQVEEEVQPNRIANSSFVTKVDGKPAGDGQHFVGVDALPENLKKFIKRCNRCTGCPQEFVI